MTLKFSKRRILLGVTVAILALASVPRFRLFAAAFSSTHTAPRARVVIVEDSRATDAFRPRPDRIREMVNQGITNLARADSVPEAVSKFATGHPGNGHRRRTTPVLSDLQSGV